MSFSKAKVLSLAKGYTGRNKNTYRSAVARVEKGLQYAFRDRKAKKREMRSQWITQINAATREYDMKYSDFMHGLVTSNIALNRKVLSELAMQEPSSFYGLVQHVTSLNLPLLQAIEHRQQRSEERKDIAKIASFKALQEPQLSLKEESHVRTNLLEINAKLSREDRQRRETLKQAKNLKNRGGTKNGR